MRALLVTWDGGGNVGPMLELGRRLGAAGHTVSALGPPSLVGRFADGGVALQARDPAGEWDPARLAADTVAEAGRTGADVVIADYMLPAALCGAASVGRPGVALVHTLYGALLADGAPHPISMAVTVDGLNGVRAGLGLPAVDAYGGVLAEAAAVLVAVPPALDDVPARLPSNVHYVGPLLEGPGPDEGWTPPFPAGDERPLAVVSMGTTPMDEAPVVAKVLCALAGLPLRVLATLPPHLAAGDLGVPDGVAITGYVRHAAVLPHASVVVTHGGLGSVTAALAVGRPLVCVPLGREQPDNAAAVARLGAGAVVAPEDVDDHLAAAVTDVLAADGHRSAAEAVARSIAAGTGTCDPVEVVAALGAA